MQYLLYQNIIELIRSKNYQRINIIGSPASGKSTLAKKISGDLGFNIIDLDDYLYNANCKRKTIDEDKKVLSKILNKAQFIIDGTYTSSLPIRIKSIDLFILISENKWKCLFRFFLRLITKNDLKCGERLTKKTIELILKYNKIEKEKIFSEIPDNKIIKFLGYE